MTEQQEKIGIDDVLEVMETGLRFGVALKNSKADGEINFADFPHWMPVIPTIGPAVDGIDKVVEQALDVDDEEKERIFSKAEEIVGVFSDKEKLMKQVIAGLKVGFALAELVESFE